MTHYLNEWKLSLHDELKELEILLVWVSKELVDYDIFNTGF